MLILSRKEHDSFTIGDSSRVTVISWDDSVASIHITCPLGMPVMREVEETSNTLQPFSEFQGDQTISHEITLPFREWLYLTSDVKFMVISRTNEDGIQFGIEYPPGISVQRIEKHNERSLSPLTSATFTGPWAGLPVAWDSQDRFDVETYRGDIARCCQAGVPGVYSGGTSGEFYAMEWVEFTMVARATVQECHAHQKPAMIGCSATYTLGAIRRARYAAELGADAIQVALPFWLEMRDEEIVDFFVDVSHSCGDLPLSIYETTRAKRTLSLDQHQAIKEQLPNYLMVKSNAGTLGFTPEGCTALSEIVNVFVAEIQWANLGPKGAKGGCSSMIYWNPDITLRYWRAVEQQNRSVIDQLKPKIDALFQYLHLEFGSRGYTDTAFDRLGGLATGFLKTSLHSRKPYPSATQEDVQLLRNWLQQNFPEMIYNTESTEAT